MIILSSREQLPWYREWHSSQWSYAPPWEHRGQLALRSWDAAVSRDLSAVFTITALGGKGGGGLKIFSVFRSHHGFQRHHQTDRVKSYLVRACWLLYVCFWMDVTTMKQVKRFDSNYLANPLFWSLCHYIGHLSIKKKKIRAFTFFLWQRTANLFGETRQTLKSPQEKTASGDLLHFHIGKIQHCFGLNISIGPDIFWLEHNVCCTCITSFSYMIRLTLSDWPSFPFGVRQ